MQADRPHPCLQRQFQVLYHDRHFSTVAILGHSNVLVWTPVVVRSRKPAEHPCPSATAQHTTICTTFAPCSFYHTYPSGTFGVSTSEYRRTGNDSPIFFHLQWLISRGCSKCTLWPLDVSAHHRCSILFFDVFIVTCVVVERVGRCCCIGLFPIPRLFLDLCSCWCWRARLCWDWWISF